MTGSWTSREIDCPSPGDSFQYGLVGKRRPVAVVLVFLLFGSAGCSRPKLSDAPSKKNEVPSAEKKISSKKHKAPGQTIKESPRNVRYRSWKELREALQHVCNEDTRWNQQAQYADLTNDGIEEACVSADWYLDERGQCAGRSDVHYDIPGCHIVSLKSDRLVQIAALPGGCRCTSGRLETWIPTDGDDIESKRIFKWDGSRFWLTYLGTMNQRTGENKEIKCADRQTSCSCDLLPNPGVERIFVKRVREGCRTKEGEPPEDWYPLSKCDLRKDDVMVSFHIRIHSEGGQVLLEENWIHQSWFAPDVDKETYSTCWIDVSQDMGNPMIRVKCAEESSGAGISRSLEVKQGRPVLMRW